MARKPVVDANADDEKAFLGRLAAPVTLSVENHFDAKPETYKGPRYSVDVVTLRVTRRTSKDGSSAGKPGPSGFFDDYYYTGGEKKQVVILHFTAGGLRGSLGALTASPSLSGKGFCSSTAYVLARDGTIYNIHDEAHWANHAHRGNADKNAIGIEIINHGYLTKSGDGFLTSAGAFYCHAADEDTHVHVLPTPYRGHTYYAKYTDAQYDALPRLLLYLTDKYNIEYRFLDESIRYDEFATYAQKRDVKGIASHVNFAGQDKAGKWIKYDIGPAMEWDRLLPRPGFRIPLDLSGKLPLTGDNVHKDPDGLRATRELLDAAYKHTEKEIKGGYFPLGANTTWHGGVHLHPPKPSAPVVAWADGEVIAARIHQTTDDTRPPLGSHNFLLMRHVLDKVAVGELLSLHIPVRYTVTKPGAAFTAGTPGKTLVRLHPGDVLRRRDAEDHRALSDVWCPVHIESLSAAVSVRTGYDVVDTGPALFADAGLTSKTLDLLPGDRLRLADSYDHEGPVPEPTGAVRVRLIKLAEDDLEIHALRVTSDLFLEFRRDPSDKPDRDPTSRKDRNRVADLQKGDILEQVDPHSQGTEEESTGRRWLKVRVKSLAAGQETITGYTITSKHARLRSSASPSSGEVVFTLSPGDTVDLLQHDSAADAKATYDLVKVAAAKVPATCTVTAKTKHLVGSPGGKNTVSLKKDDVLRILGPLKRAKGSDWLHVQTVPAKPGAAPETGWISTSGVQVTEDDFKNVPWAKALLDGKHLFVDAKSSYGSAITAPRPTDPPKGEGYVSWPNRSLEVADGLKRSKAHAGLLNTGKPPDPAKFYYVKVPAAALAETGQRRPERFAKDIGKTDGFIKYEPGGHFNLAGDVPQAAKDGLVGKPFYSLCMHLDDTVELYKDNAKLAPYDWLPRQPTKYTITGQSEFYADQARSSSKLSLIAGDKLDAAGRILPNSPMRAATLAELADAQVVTSIAVKADALLLEDHDSPIPLAALATGDVLAPGDNYDSDSPLRPVRIKSFAPGECDARYIVKRRGPVLFADPKNKKSSLLLLEAGDELRVITPCLLPARDHKWNYVEVDALGPLPPKAKDDPGRRTGLRGWLAVGGKSFKKYFEPAVTADRAVVHAGRTDAAGFVRWNKKALEEKTESRKALHAGLIGASGWLEYSRSAMDVESELDDVALKALASGQVVNLAVGGQEQHSPEFPRVGAGAPLWPAGVYGDLREDPAAKRQPRIHWEIFSAENLMRFHTKTWTEAVDADGDYNVDNEKIIAAIKKALESQVPRGGPAPDAVFADNVLDSAEIAAFYANNPEAAALRRFACKFVIEWGIDVDSALKGLKIAPRHPGVLKEFLGRMKRMISSQLWWDEAVTKRNLAPHLPPTKHLYHYNPIAFLEAFSEADLARQAATKK